MPRAPFFCMTQLLETISPLQQTPKSAMSGGDAHSNFVRTLTGGGDDAKFLHEYIWTQIPQTLKDVFGRNDRKHVIDWLERDAQLRKGESRPDPETGLPVIFAGGDSLISAYYVETHPNTFVRVALLPTKKRPRNNTVPFDKLRTLCMKVVPTHGSSMGPFALVPAYNRNACPVETVHQFVEGYRSVRTTIIVPPPSTIKCDEVYPDGQMEKRL